MKDSGPDHQKLFRAVVKVGSRDLGQGEGRSKKAAEQLAAEAAYREITEGETLGDPPPAGVGVAGESQPGTLRTAVPAQPLAPAQPPAADEIAANPAPGSADA